MTQDNPLLQPQVVNRKGPVNDPKKVRVFKAAQISTMPCIEKSRHAIGDEEFNLREEYSIESSGVSPAGKKLKTQRYKTRDTLA